jgi:predicted lipoprotein
MGWRTGCGMKKRLPVVVLLAGVGILWVAFPPFHVRSLKTVRQAQESKRLDVAGFVARLWTEALLPATRTAADAAIVTERLVADPKSVREEYGRTVGLGSSYYLFLRGTGRVVSADEDSIGLSLKGDGDEVQILIERGFVFGNAVRDATGLIEASSYPNAQEFNDVSAALNSIVETHVLPRLQHVAKVGNRIRFAGCAEVGDEEQDQLPLRLVPIEVEPE